MAELPQYLIDQANEIKELRQNEHETALTGKKAGESGGVTTEAYGLAELRSLIIQKEQQFATDYSQFIEEEGL